MEVQRDFGKTFTEEEFKRGLQELNPSIQFDVGGRLGYYHPMIDMRQGVWYNERHITSMERGAIPEYNVWAVVERAGRKVRSHILKVGWRHTMERMVRKSVPNVTWESLCAKFNVDRKYYVGDPAELEID